MICDNQISKICVYIKPTIAFEVISKFWNHINRIFYKKNSVYDITDCNVNNNNK